MGYLTHLPSISPEMYFFMEGYLIQKSKQISLIKLSLGNLCCGSSYNAAMYCNSIASDHQPGCDERPDFESHSLCARAVLESADL